MSRLLEQLQAIDSAITPAQAADLRAGLVAINRQTQSQPDSAAWSLTRWCQWLDDEGYSREDLLEILRRLSLATLGEQGLAQLAQFCVSIADESHGLSLLLGLLEERDPDLLARLHSLEMDALAEEAELAQTAGGMSKLARNSLIAIGVGTVTGLLYFAHSEYKTNQAIKKIMKERLDAFSKAAERTLSKDVDELHDLETIVQDDTEEAAADLLRNAEDNPQRAMELYNVVNEDLVGNYKRISRYTPEDIADRAAKYMIQDGLVYVGKAVEKVVAQEIMNSSEFRQQVIDLACKDPKFDRDIMDAEDGLNSVLSPNGTIFDKAKQAVIDGDWFAQAKIALKNSGRGKQLIDQETTKAYNAYHSFLSDEVAYARDLVKEDAIDALDPFFGGTLLHQGKHVAKRVDLKAEEDIDNLVKEAESALRNAERVAGEDVRGADRLIS